MSVYGLRLLATATVGLSFTCKKPKNKEQTGNHQNELLNQYWNVESRNLDLSKTFHQHHQPQISSMEKKISLAEKLSLFSSVREREYYNKDVYRVIKSS